MAVVKLQSHITSSLRILAEKPVRTEQDVHSWPEQPDKVHQPSQTSHKVVPWFVLLAACPPKWYSWNNPRGL